MPATTMGANENFPSLCVNSLSETQRGKREMEGGRERESMYENEREIHTWLREK